MTVLVDDRLKKARGRERRVAQVRSPRPTVGAAKDKQLVVRLDSIERDLGRK